MRDYTKKIIYYYFVVITVGLFLLPLLFFNAAKSHDLLVHIFDVGQGDAIFVETPLGHRILIDGGPNAIVINKLDALLPMYDRTIDLIILTHPHADHLTGLLTVLNRFTVKQILTTDVSYDSPQYQSWVEALKKFSGHIDIANHAGILSIEPGIDLQILFPDHDIGHEQINNLNNTSIVAKLVDHNISALFQGDYDNEEMLTNNPFIHANVLKVGHHGSKDASSISFLRAVHPIIAVISCGRHNPYHHPSPMTLTNFQSIGAHILRTDIAGDITLVSDGRTVWSQ